MDIRQIGGVQQLIAVYCPNVHGIHPTIYIRYIILVGSTGYLFLDDPTEEDCTRMWQHAHSTSQVKAIASVCPWCSALDSL